ncbi:MAG TPA: 3-phosphoshikimate 1-carboxyvinyltransferase [Usitatibacter sp.]|jgi:3-phosphoshikimate 1-carboxyvinyltransferase|nr:3-phosphoshikimate 1-carboxyvinyltransferase [Usitatibacter sp.]
MSSEPLFLQRVSRALGRLRLPGSKSISNRMLLLAALARGDTVLEGLLDSDDTRVMREALQSLGVSIENVGANGQVRVGGLGPARGFPVKSGELFMGNAGTAARSLTAVLAFSDGHYVLKGVPRMHERPIGDLVDTLLAAGAQIDYLEKPGFPPLSILPRMGGTIPTLRIKGEVSSQFVTAVLLALPWAGGNARLEITGELVSRPYVSLTLGLMKRFGVEVKHDEELRTFEVPATDGYVSPGQVTVEGDASSASYFLAAAAIGRGPVRVEGVGSASVQGDVAFVDVLRTMGAKVEMGPEWIECEGKLPLRAFDLDLNLIPDAAMTAAVLALFTEGGPCTLSGIQSWRVKETDRISAMATELRKFGARVQEGANFLRIYPPVDFLAPRTSTVAPVSIDTYDDHRMAMCFSLAAFGPRPVKINDPGCVAKTFPDYFTAFAQIAS